MKRQNMEDNIAVKNAHSCSQRSQGASTRGPQDAQTRPCIGKHTDVL